VGLGQYYKLHQFSLGQSPGGKGIVRFEAQKSCHVVVTFLHRFLVSAERLQLNLLNLYIEYIEDVLLFQLVPFCLHLYG